VRCVVGHDPKSLLDVYRPLQPAALNDPTLVHGRNQVKYY
jgi:hypothetical protein